MAVSITKAREFVYENGSVWERTLFAYLFEGGSIERVHQCLLCYKNADNGFGHGLELDIKTPDSHPAALEYMLGLLVRDLNLPVGTLFEGTAAWLEAQREADGSLKNPSSLNDYPIAPWWAEWGGQSAPDSITGNLTKLGLVTPSLAESTQLWVQQNLTLEKIQANEWLFMAYHAHDYFMNVRDFPEVEVYRAALIENIRACAEKMPEKQYAVLLQFAPTPDSPVAQAMPDLVKRSLDYLMEAQWADGGWEDEHGIKHWQPSLSIIILHGLQRHWRI